MKKQGCEIEAVGITYKIYSHNNENSFSIFKKQNGEHGNQTSSSSSSSSSSGMRTVLNQVNCRAKPWEILAIVGPSGAGKSSLLEILAGKLTPQAGSIFINSNAIEKATFNKISGFVTQKDMLFPLLTVEETLMFSAKLKLKLPPSELSSRVKSLMQELGIDHVAKTRVGNDGIRGVSGGERRRVSIGVDVIHDPKVLILDEPTSGLDSTSALQIIDMLKNMAERRGRTIILSIHQPGFRIVKLFNSIVLLANGTILHHGTVDRLGSKLCQMGLELPPHCNIVEFAIDYLPFLLILAILFTVPVYWLVGLRQEFTAFSHFLLLIWLILYTANSVVVCFSALVPNFIVGNSVISGVMGSFFLFSGYFISKKEIPRYWIGMHYLSLFKYPYEGFLINEFSGSNECLKSMFGMCAMTGKDVLKEEGFREENRWMNVLITVCFILLYRFISYVILRCRCSKRSFKGALI